MHLHKLLNYLFKKKGYTNKSKYEKKYSFPAGSVIRIIPTHKEKTYTSFSSVEKIFHHLTKEIELEVFVSALELVEAKNKGRNKPKNSVKLHQVLQRLFYEVNGHKSKKRFARKIGIAPQQVQDFIPTRVVGRFTTTELIFANLTSDFSVEDFIEMIDLCFKF